MRVAISIPPPATITSGPLLGASIDDDRLLAQLVHAEPVERTLGRTETGWPYTMLRAISGSEHRIATMYCFGEWRGYVLVHFDDAALAPQIEAALQRATPDWRGDGEVHCIVELFE